MTLRLVKTNLSPSSAGAYSCRRLAVNALSWQVVVHFRGVECWALG